MSKQTEADRSKQNNHTLFLSTYFLYGSKKLSIFASMKHIEFLLVTKTEIEIRFITRTEAKE